MAGLSGVLTSPPFRMEREHPPFAEAGNLHLRAGWRGSDAVVHAASPGDANTAAYDETAACAIIGGLRGTSKRFIYTSGCLVYGPTGDTPATEGSPLTALELVRYREALEREILDTAGDGIHPVVIRPGWVYGNRGGTAMMMVCAAAEHGVARYVGDGRNRWTTVHADDLADLYALALERAPAGSVFNGVHGAATTLIEIARAASEAAGAGGGWKHGRSKTCVRCFGRSPTP